MLLRRLVGSEARYDVPFNIHIRRMVKPSLCGAEGSERFLRSASGHRKEMLAAFVQVRAIVGATNAQHTSDRSALLDNHQTFGIFPAISAF